MALFDRVFRDGEQGASGGPESIQLPMQVTHEALGEVNVRVDGKQRHVTFTFLMDPVDEAEGWQTGVALDASESMAGQFGRLYDSSKMPKEAWQAYAQRNWVTQKVVDGQTRYSLTPEGLEEARRQGYVQYTKNVMQPIAQEFIAYLAGKLDADGGTTVAYWACGPQGDQYEIVGDLTAEQCRTATFRGPEKVPMGKGTCLTPIARYFVERFNDAPKGIYVFITDGRLDDMQQLMDYTWELARARAEGRQNMVKFVLIGVGRHIDENQMAQLDDMLDNSGLVDAEGNGIDIWDHKVANDLRTSRDLFTEVVNENQIIAPSGRIMDDKGTVVLNMANGVTAKVSFTMPAKAKFFEIEVGDQRIRQTVETG